jgi:phosphate transport system substrate-binding protein
VTSRLQTLETAVFQNSFDFVTATSPAPWQHPAEVKTMMTTVFSGSRGRALRARHALTAGLGILLVGLALALPGRAQAGTVTVKGSDTMVVLGQRWAEEFMRKNPKTTIQVTGGGSGTGISALINGTTDVCEASRAMKDAEKKQLAEKAGAPPVEIPVAKDGLSVYVNESNPLSEITMADLKAIFTGKITTWKELGGSDTKIIPYSRENSSGTYVFFKEHVLENADFTPRAQNMPGTAAVVNAVTKEKFAIGYGGAAYAKGIKVLKIKKTATTPAVAPAESAIKDGTYPLSRPLFFYTRANPAADIKSFTDWVLSPEGQAIVVKVGYFPLK